jgi:hypothetical protein
MKLAEIYSWLADQTYSYTILQASVRALPKDGNRINQIAVLASLGEQVLSGAVSEQEALGYFLEATELLNSFDKLNLLPEFVAQASANVLTRESGDAIARERLSSFPPSTLRIAGTFYQKLEECLEQSETLTWE